jgi:hypothetical protein
MELATMNAVNHPLEVAITLPALLLFEVMDKEPLLVQTAILYGVLATCGFLLSRKRWWWGLLVLPIVVLFACIDFGELYDPFIGPAIIEEAGYTHFLAWQGFILGGLLLPVLASVLKKRSVRRDVLN